VLLVLFVGQYFLVKDAVLCGVFVLCVVMALTLTFFLAYHLVLTAQNTTTNETFKWSSARAFRKEAVARAKSANEIAGKEEKGGERTRRRRRRRRGGITNVLYFLGGLGLCSCLSCLVYTFSY